MKKENHRKSLAILLLSSMLAALLSGCGAPAENGNGTNTEEAGNTGVGGQDALSSADGVAMGRYLEEVTDLSGQITGYNEQIYRLSDGSMVITDAYVDFLRSEDNGVTWETDKRDWRTAMLEENVYIMSVAISTDGTVGIIYEDNATNKEDDEEEESAEPYELNPNCMIIKPDGTEIPVEISVTEDDEYPNAVWIAENGRMFVSTLGPNIYEIYEDGSSVRFLTVDRRPQLIRFVGDKMIMDGYNYDGLLIYDMKQKKYIEDEVLNDFVNENYADRSWNGDSWYDLYFFPGEDDILYLAGQKGVHRHVLGGSAIEQIIDGSLCTFNNPAYGLFGMVSLENNEFMALFGSGRLVRFTYHPEVPTVPSESIKAYSLQDNSILRRAISIYQTEHPEIYVEYEIGMEDGSSVTREDALKKVNTEIMAGEGPDLLVLDNMPIDSYIDKGLLLDLSPVADELSGEEALFPNVVEAFRTDGKLYMIPYEFGIPVAIGDKAYIQDMDDLEGIAETMEALRAANPGKNLLNICSAKGIIRKFTPLCASAWKTESGEIDTDAVTAFLEGCKRIYDAQMDGISEEIVEQYEEANEVYIEFYGFTKEDMEYFASQTDAISYLMKNNLLEVGAVDYAYDYSDITSIPRVKGFENREVVLISGQSRNVFYPNTLVGISAASAHTKQAEDLLRVLLGKENGSYGDFVTNMAAFEANLIPNEQFYVSDDEPYSYWAGSDEYGNYIEMAVYWMDGAEKEILRGWAETVTTPYVKDVVLEETLCTEGVRYIEGSQNMEETINAVKEKISIYMAE